MCFAVVMEKSGVSQASCHPIRLILASDTNVFEREATGVAVDHNTQAAFSSLSILRNLTNEQQYIRVDLSSGKTKIIGFVSSGSKMKIQPPAASVGVFVADLGVAKSPR